MKKIRKTIYFALAAVILCSQGIFANAKSHDWYFKPSQNGERPICFGGSSMPDDYGCIYLGPPEKVIYLTFDAGYENGNVAKTLDILKKHSAPAAFFILPHLVSSEPELVLRMEDEGHLVCNHSNTHRDMSAMSKSEIAEELSSAENAYAEATGRTMAKFFRPPEGRFSEKTLKYVSELGYTTVFWSFAYADWDNTKQKDVSWARDKLLSSAHDGEVLLLHPNSATNAAILDDVLTELEARGYRFGSLSELVEADPTLSADVYKRLEAYKRDGIVFSDCGPAGKVMALTFDDGPHPVYTAEILDILSEFGVKATFFVVGKNITGNESLVKRAIDEGHEIGVHTFSHKIVSRLSLAELESEIRGCENLLSPLGVYPVLFRPPGGEICFEAMDALKSMGYTSVLWSWRMNTLDWQKGRSVSAVVSSVMSNLRGGDVPLFHDYNAFETSPTPNALKALIPRLVSEGYRFCTVSELISLSSEASEGR